MGEMLTEWALGLCLDVPHPCNRWAWWTREAETGGCQGLAASYLAELQAQWQTVSKNKAGDDSYKKTVDPDLTLTFGPDVHTKENTPAHMYTHACTHSPDKFSVILFSSQTIKTES